MGVRAQESIIRSCSVISAGGHLTKANPFGARHCRPIYDWTDGDVWRAIGTNRWDYNHAYDVFHRHGMPARKLRIAPPSQSPAGADQIRIAQQAWPSWFDRVDERLPGFRAIAHYGPKAVQPHRRAGETWEECFTRVCMVEAPKWIAARAELARGRMLKAHRAHATTPFPERETCNSCNASTNSWRKLTQAMFLGDPFAQKASFLPYVEPEFFRLGAGTWGGNPAA
jgi:predicted phosphoadenosine phosphosulfate sulfurtransferase